MRRATSGTGYFIAHPGDGVHANSRRESGETSSRRRVIVWRSSSRERGPPGIHVRTCVNSSSTVRAMLLTQLRENLERLISPNRVLTRNYSIPALTFLGFPPDKRPSVGKPCDFI